MLKNRTALAAIATASLLAAAPAFADGNRHSRPYERTVVVHQHTPYHARGWERARGPVYGHRPAYVRRTVVVHRPVVVQQPPVVVYRSHSHSDVLGGLIIGTVLGAVIASNAGY
ncbi:MAG TPA: hypothetical protein VF262_00050 [Burkholderiales bacterium]